MCLLKDFNVFVYQICSELDDKLRLMSVVHPVFESILATSLLNRIKSTVLFLQWILFWLMSLQNDILNMSMLWVFSNLEMSAIESLSPEQSVSKPIEKGKKNR